MPCDHCGTSHYRKAHRLVRNVDAKRRQPTSGMWLCSRTCQNEVEKAAQVATKCLKCGTEVIRRRSQIKKRIFCSKDCADSYGLSEVKCTWPGCCTMMPCRTFDRIDRRGRVRREHKTVLAKGAAYTKYVLCDHHHQIVVEHLGHSARVTSSGIKLEEGATWHPRSASGRFMRMVLFERAGRCCQKCGTALSFDGPAATWNVDHAIPVFKGGETSLSNLQILCWACHDAKSAVEKSEASRERYRLHERRMTHHEKDGLVARLRARLEALGEPLD